MSTEQEKILNAPMPSIEKIEIVPEVVEYLCTPCYEPIFIRDFLDQKLSKLDVTFERLPDAVPDEDDVMWGVLCQGKNPDQNYGRHLAQFRVTRHKIMAEILKQEQPK